VDLRKALLQAADEVFEIFERQIRMQTANYVKFGNRLGVAAGRRLERFFQRHGVGAGRVLLAAEGAETAGGNADIRGVDVAVDVEVRHVAVHSLPNVIRQPADGENIRRAIKLDAVFK